MTAKSASTAGSHIPSWFVVLPDSAAAEQIGATLRRSAAQLVPHPSGRPWLLGRWADHEMAVARSGNTCIAAVGQHDQSAESLMRLAGRLSSTSDLDAPCRMWAGSFHLIASIAGQVRVQGSVSCFRRVFHSEMHGITIGADRADVLATLTGAELDESRLAVCLIEPFAPHPIGGEPVWRGIHAVPGDQYLIMDGRGRSRSARWWTAPEPLVPLAKGAARLREALTAAVEARIKDRHLVSTDLGGLDSTALCCLAAHGPAQVAAFTWAGRDPLTDDEAWARRTAAAFPTLEHHVIPGSQRPAPFSGVNVRDDPLDEPCALTLDRRWLVIAAAARQRGSAMHFGGFGGDEVLRGSPAHLHQMFRQTPRTALRHLRGFAVQDRWSYRTALAQLLDQRSYRAWLARFSDELRAAPPPPGDPMLDWAKPVRLPPWATPAATIAVRDLAKASAATAEPVGHGHGQHQELAGLRAIARMIRHLGCLSAQLGLTLAAPYYDDRVIEAGLAVRPQDRVTPWRYKPLIVEAMRGIVPEVSRTRQTKADGSYEIEVGLREYRKDLLTLCEDSRLARLGLIDASALREVVARPLTPTLDISALYPTLAVEVWLRAHERSAVPV